MSFVLGAIALFSLMGYVLHSSLQSKDRDLLQAKFHEYSILVDVHGIKGLQNRFSKTIIPDASKYLIRYQTKSGKTLFLHVPPTMEIVGWTVELEELVRILEAQAKNGNWHEIPGPDYGDNVEVYSQQLPNGDLLQIGKDTEDREEFLLQFARSFSIVFFPVLFLAIAIGFILAGRLLSPIRWLSQVVSSIRSGQSDARVKLKGNGDELDTLGNAFNQMQDQNVKLVQSLKETLDHVAHDLRTPVMRMQNASSTALQKIHFDEKEGFAKNALESCQENSETILKILNAIMDISEIETGAIILHKEKFTTDELVTSLIDIYSFIAEEKGIRIVVSVEKNISFSADKARLLQAIANILDNAIKYSPPDSDVNLICRGTSSEVIFEISDQGSGIKPEDQEKIWDRLFRGDASRSTRGLGLGLSVVRAMAVAHGGTVTFHNNSTIGCTFIFAIPISP